VAVAVVRDDNWRAVEEVIAGLRPHIQADGGDMRLVAVQDKQVTVALSGSCSGCMMTDMTLAWLQQKLIERLGRFVHVVAEGAPATISEAE